jgi:hypothetical protein
MKFMSRFAVMVASLCVTFTAMGGHGQGGGVFGKTRLMLQSFDSELAVLAVEGSINFPESETTPRLVIPEDEYLDFVAEVEREGATEKPFVLSVDQEDGSVRNFTLCHSKLGKEPLYLFLVVGNEEEVKCPDPE